MNEKLSKKAINFDLDTNLLKKYYPNSNITYAYTEIKNFLLKNDFSHRQGSGYITNKNVSDFYIDKLVSKMAQKFPWLSKCIKEFDVTNIGETFSLKKTISEATKALAMAEPIKNKQEKSNSLTNRLSLAKENANKLNSQSKAIHSKNKTNNIEL